MTSDGEIRAQKNSASFYSKRYSGFGDCYHFEIVMKLFQLVGSLENDAKILDVGCGTGYLSQCFEKYVRPVSPFIKTDIIGIDVSDDMLALNPFQWKKASADNIPFNDESFDLVVCRSVLHHLERPRLAMEEIKRVLKPGGRFVCWETNKGFLAHWVRKMTQHGDRFNEYHGDLGGIPYLVDDYLDVSNVKYGGFFGYILCGFPDIVDFPYFIKRHWRALMRIDEAIPQWIMKHIGFYVTVKATK